MENKERMVQGWWDNLLSIERVEVISNIRPDEYIPNDIEYIWEELDWEIQLQIYKEWNE